MTSVVFYFQVHQPYRLQRYTFFDIGTEKSYFDEGENERILKRVAEKCYVPMNRILLNAIEKTDGRFRCAFSLSGTVLNQLEQWAPEALKTFQALGDTGNVEFLCETSHHSLASLADAQEFEAQVRAQRDKIRRLLRQTPQSFRNTELIFNNRIARTLEALGFQSLLGEGADRLLGELSPNVVYKTKGCEQLKLLLRSYVFSDDIAFRFSNKEWDEYPLMADTFAKWLERVPRTAPFIGLFMDYETFGEHQWAETGILDFMEYLPEYILQNPRFDFQTPGQIAQQYPVEQTLDVPDPVSWADAERDVSAWLGNPMQDAAHAALYELAPQVREADRLGHHEMVEIWRKLTTSDHVYYMCTKWFSDGDVHKYFSPYATPHDAFITFMNVLEDYSKKLNDIVPQKSQTSVP